MTTPLAFNDEELTVLREAARPIEPDRRSAFLQMVAASLQEPRSPGALIQAAAKAQRILLTAAVGPRR
jgi:hypothetical protein